MPTPAPQGNRPHWSERAWARTLRGGRGRPLGLVVLLAGLALVLAPESRPMRAVRLAFFDMYQFRAPRERLSAPAVIVEIDEASLARYGQWPWPRTLLARLVTLIGQGRPAAIGLDVIMPEPDRLSPGRLPALVPAITGDLADRLAHLPSNDHLLAVALAGVPAVLGVAAIEPPAGASAPLRPPPVRVVGADPAPFVRRYEGALGSLDEIAAAARGHGLLNVDPERGVVRRVPLVASVAGDLMPGLAVEMLRVAAGQPAYTVRSGARGVEAVIVGDLAIPTQPSGTVWIRYSRHDPERFVSAAEVLAGRVDPSRFAQKLVLIGVTALGLVDFQATPVADRMPGVEIHAQLIEGIFDGDLLSRPWWTAWAEAALLAVAGILVILAVPALPVLVSAAVFVLLAGGMGALALVAFLRLGILLDAAIPAAALGAVFTTMIGVSLADTQFQRRLLRREVAEQREAAARLAGELEAARRIQMGSLPTPAAAFPGERRFDLCAIMEPAREVGGDLYDFFRLDGDRILIMIGDVSGKGLPGSLFMVVSKSLLKTIALRGPAEIGALMREADTQISRDNAEGLFVTVWAGVLDAATGDIEYGSAGHDAPYLLGRGDRALGRLAEGGGPPLCVIDEFPYAGSRYRLAPGETICLVTDGVTEAQSAGGELYGRERLESLLGGLPPGSPPEEIAEAIRRDVARFAAGVDPADDLAILVLRWNGPVSGR